MKKIIKLILLLTGCSIEEFRQEIENLQLELSQVKEQNCNTQSNTQDEKVPEAPTETAESETPEAKPSETTTKAVTNDMFDFLTMSLQSKHYANWNAVANCDYATEEHLLKVAIQCAKISNSDLWAIEIATSICQNPAATGKVIKELSNSRYYNVWNVAAQSPYADDEALISIAKKCANICNESFAIEIATSICQNPAATGKVIKELSNSKWYDVWNVVAQSPYADEEALISIAKKCANISNKYAKSFAITIATSICQNPAATGKVIKELSNSRYYNVWNVAAQSPYADEEALISIAKKCANISNNKSLAGTIAINICQNPATTCKVLTGLAKTNYTDVIVTAFQKLEEMQ